MAGSQPEVAIFTAAGLNREGSIRLFTNGARSGIAPAVRHAAEAGRVRSAIEARAEAGLAEARALRDQRLEQRAEARRRWARSLRRAGPDDLRAALLSAFTNAFDRWTAPV